MTTDETPPQDLWMSKAFGRKLAELRTSAGLDHDALAARTRQTLRGLEIHQIEEGERAVSLDEAQVLASALRVDILILIGAKAVRVNFGDTMKRVEMYSDLTGIAPNLVVEHLLSLAIR